MELVIAGWRPGLKTISLMDALRRYKGVGLKQAKQEVDGLLAGQSIRLPDLNAEAIAKAQAELEALGCVYR
jgi:ribosomal protein L7/L12